MPGSVASYGFARAVAAENDLSFVPRLYKRDATVRGVIYCHGAGGLACQPQNTDPAVYALVHAIAEVFPVACLDLGGSGTWGNATVQSRVTSAKTWLQSTSADGAPGAKAGTVLLVGTSMGGASLLQWAKNNVASVAAMVGIIPITSINDVYQNDKGGYRSTIGTAWGVTYPTALPADALNINTASLYNGIPTKIWAASNDSIASTTATCTTFVAGMTPAGTVVDVGALDHSNAAIAAVPPVDVVAFLATYA